MNTTQKQIPYNCYINNKGFLMPKSIVMHNDPEILSWLENNEDSALYSFFYLHGLKAFGQYSSSRPYIEISFSHSNQGFLYCTIMSWDENFYSKYFKPAVDSLDILSFDNDIEGLKAYLTWVFKMSKKGPKFTMKFKK